jgi:hypothetical protein
LPKNDFLLREGQITVQVRERIKFDRNIDYVARTKQMRKYYTETFATICNEIENENYFKSFVRYNYFYKGMEVWREVKKEFAAIKNKNILPLEINGNTVLIENSGYGVFAFIYALSHKNMQIIAIENNEEKLEIARNCAGLPQNIKFYNHEEWKNTLS